MSVLIDNYIISERRGVIRVRHVSKRPINHKLITRTFGSEQLDLYVVFELVLKNRISIEDLTDLDFKL